MGFNRKDLLGIRDLEVAEIEYLLDLSRSFKEINERSIKKVPTLRGQNYHSPFLRTEHQNADLL